MELAAAVAEQVVLSHLPASRGRDQRAQARRMAHPAQQPPPAAPPGEDRAVQTWGRDSPVARGAALYFAQGCQLCHGATGNAPANLSLPARRRARGRPRHPAGKTRYASVRIGAAH